MIQCFASKEMDVPNKTTHCPWRRQFPVSIEVLYSGRIQKSFCNIPLSECCLPLRQVKGSAVLLNLKRRSSVQTLHFLFKEPGTRDRSELKHGNFLWEKWKLWLSEISVRYIPYLRQIRHSQKRCTPVKRTLRFRIMHLFIWRYTISSERTLHVFKRNSAYSADTAVRSFNEHMKRKQHLHFSLAGSCFFKGRLLHTLWAPGGYRKDKSSSRELHCAKVCRLFFRDAAFQITTCFEGTASTSHSLEKVVSSNKHGRCCLAQG